MKVISLNIRTLYRDTKRQSEHWWVARYRAIHEYIKEQAPDIICLQEVWWPAKYVLRLGALGYKKTGWGFSHPIFVRKNQKMSKRRVSLFSTMAIVGDIQVFSVHCRWEEKLFQRAMKWICKQSVYDGKKRIAAGDFNTSNIRKVEDATYLSSVRRMLEMESVDTFANYRRPEESHEEIDHFFTGCIHVPIIESYSVGPDDLSDHRPIVFSFKDK